MYIACYGSENFAEAFGVGGFGVRTQPCFLLRDPDGGDGAIGFGEYRAIYCFP